MMMTNIFPNRPMGATHYFMYPGHPEPGGTWVYYVSFFKKVDGDWVVYTTDTDNEYPGWSLAEKHYKNKSFELMKQYLMKISID